MEKKKILIISFLIEKQFDDHYKNVPPCPISVNAELEMVLTNKAGIPLNNVVWLDLFAEKDAKISLLRARIPKGRFTHIIIESKVLLRLRMKIRELARSLFEKSQFPNIKKFIEIDSRRPNYCRLVRSLCAA